MNARDFYNLSREAQAAAFGGMNTDERAQLRKDLHAYCSTLDGGRTTIEGAADAVYARVARDHHVLTSGAGVHQAERRELLEHFARERKENSK